MHMGSFNLQKGNPGKLKMREREMKENHPGGTPGFVSRITRDRLLYRAPPWTGSTSAALS